MKLEAPAVIQAQGTGNVDCYRNQNFLKSLLSAEIQLGVCNSVHFKLHVAEFFFTSWQILS
jgi:hypothetical protein